VAGGLAAGTDVALAKARVPSRLLTSGSLWLATPDEVRARLKDAIVEAKRIRFFIWVTSLLIGNSQAIQFASLRKSSLHLPSQEANVWPPSRRPTTYPEARMISGCIIGPLPLVDT
jgi:hypothetical protein